MTDNITYAAGDSAHVTVQIAYPSWAEGTSPYVFCRLRGENGTIAESQEMAALSDGQIVLKIPVSVPIENPAVYVDVRDESVVLDSYKFTVSAPEAAVNTPPTAIPSGNTSNILEAVSKKNNDIYYTAGDSAFWRRCRRRTSLPRYRASTRCQKEASAAAPAEKKRAGRGYCRTIARI